MKKVIASQDQVFWYLQRPEVHCLRESIEADVVIIGGGMAGLTTAQSFAQKKKKVVLLEAYYCGAGASGKSSGFITPNSEISLSDFIARYGQEGGKTIWRTIEGGSDYIRTNIKQYNLNCDYILEDSLFVANSKRDLKQILTEYENVTKSGSATSYFEKKDLSALLGSTAYYGGMTYQNTFGIDAYKYCQEMKEILIKQGVYIYEETPAVNINNHTVSTLHATVKAKNIIVCADRFIPEFGVLSKQIYHMQNFLLISQVLTDAEKKIIFPDRNLMVWDTDLLYSYFRMTGNRLLLGGGSLFLLYNKHENHHSKYVYNKQTRYWRKKFPQLELQFEQFWPAMIGISKDIAPIFGQDKDNKSVYYIAATAGLPVAAALGNYCADHIVDGRDDLKDYFSPYRKFFISGLAQRILGTKLSFALSNLIAMKF